MNSIKLLEKADSNVGHAENEFRSRLESEMRNFVTLFRQVRESEGLSLRKVAKKLKISPSYLSDIERNNRHPNFELRARMIQIIRNL